MKNYLKSRFQQMTTWTGIASIGFAIATASVPLSAELIMQIPPQALLALGLVHVNA